jgi:hypothetical protein
VRVRVVVSIEVGLGQAARCEGRVKYVQGRLDFAICAKD